MLKRTLTGAVLVAAVTGFFFLRSVANWTFLLLISFIVLLGNFEMNRMLGPRTHISQKILSFVSAVLLCLSFIIPAAFETVHFSGVRAAALTLALSAAAMFLLPVFLKGKPSAESVAFSLLSVIYPGAFLCPLFMMNGLKAVSLFALILTFAVTPCCDVLAYLTGRLFKGRKLCPEISPNKTVSGAIGGLLGGIAGSVIVYAILQDTFLYHLFANPYFYFAVVGFAAAVLTELGDLFESYLKRSFNVKDSGKIFPGHGGMLDRVDGLIFASVFIYAVASLL